MISSKETNASMHYDVIQKNAEKKIISMFAQLSIDSFTSENKVHYFTTYYDTVENLLNRAGILMYKTYENGSYYIKIDRIGISSTSSTNRKEVFAHKVEAKDTPYIHSFFLINGISNLFSTQFSIDLEHVIKSVIPKITIEIESSGYKAFSGTGFKCHLAFEKCIYKNLVTKRKHENDELVVDFQAPHKFLDEFSKFCTQLEKYCKGIIPKNERRYLYATRLTQPLSKDAKNKKFKKEKVKKEKKKKEKELRPEDRID